MSFTRRVKLLSAALPLLGVSAAVSAQAPAAPAAAVEQARQPKLYSAETFFATTSYSMASSAGFGFSADGRSLLISSDKSGVFNAHVLPIDGGQMRLFERPR